jgi:hypothetical protein
MRCIGGWDDLNEVSTFWTTSSQSHALIPGIKECRLTIDRVVDNLASALTQLETGEAALSRFWGYEESTINTIWHLISP